MPGDDTRFYAVFTTTGSGFHGSAVCVFTLDAIQDAFKGKFKEQATSSSAWLPVLSSKVPEPRPGECVNDTQTLPGTGIVILLLQPPFGESYIDVTLMFFAFYRHGFELYPIPSLNGRSCFS